MRYNISNFLDGGERMARTAMIHARTESGLKAEAEIRTFPDVMIVQVYDEDWLKYTDEVRELGQLIQEDTEFGLRKLNWFSPSSIESLSQYEYDELPLQGFKGTFIGVESKFAPKEGYQKRTGEAKETIHELLKRGIYCSGGLMLGFDFHDRVNIQEDINYYVACELTSHQISRVFPFPGTPLWYRLQEEGRVYDVPWIDINFYGGGYKHKNFEPHEIEHLILEGYRKFYETWWNTLHSILFWILPFSILFFVLRAQIVRVALGAGNFNWTDTRLTAAFLGILSIASKSSKP